MSKNLAHFLIKFLAIYLFYISIRYMPLNDILILFDYLRKTTWAIPNYGALVVSVLQFGFVAFLWFKTEVILLKMKGLQAEKTKLSDWKKLSHTIVFTFGLYLTLSMVANLHYILAIIFSSQRGVLQDSFTTQLFSTFLITLVQLVITIVVAYICLFRGDKIVAFIARQSEGNDVI